MSHQRISIRAPRFGAEQAERLERAADEAFRQGASGLIINLSRVSDLEARGVRALSALSRRAPRGARVALCGAAPQVARAARVACLHELFAFYASAEAAEAALRPQPTPAPSSPPRRP